MSYPVRTQALVILSLVVVMACGESKNETTSKLQQNPPVAGDDAALAIDMPKKKKRGGMRNCPNSVRGAVSTGWIEDDAIVVEVRGAATDEVARRAQYLIAAVSGEGERRHSGNRVGDGKQGQCPVVIPGTSMSVEKFADYVKIVLVTTDGESASDKLQQVQQRIDLLAQGQAGARVHGSGHGEQQGGGEASGKGSGDADQRLPDSR